MKLEQMKSRIFAIAAVSGVAFVPGALATRPLTTTPDVFVPIHVTISDSKISLDRHTAYRGDAARFIIRNIGGKTHNFTLGATTRRGSSRQSGFSRTIKPKQRQIILMFLDYRGPLPYRSAIKVDLVKPGMKGIFKIL